VTARTTVLILGGTAEARALAALLAGRPDLRIVVSYAGRTSAPAEPDGTSMAIRVGGFGGAAGLRDWLAAHAPALLVDATHPFAATMSRHAAEVGAPLLRLTRPGWTARPGDRWHRVPDLPAAADVLPSIGRRAFLSTGRQRLSAFTTHPGCAKLPLLLVRCVEPPPGPLPANVEVVLDRGPFTVGGELALLRRHRIDAVVARDSGGDATRAKLDAARDLGVPVVLVDRPPARAVPTVHTPAEAATWVTALASVGSGACCVLEAGPGLRVEVPSG
jgi:precorrin-6A/cobalt-precorrin-6A reductase